MEPVVFEKVKMVSGGRVCAVWMAQGLLTCVEGRAVEERRGEGRGGEGEGSLRARCTIAPGTKGRHIRIRSPAAISAAFPLPCCCPICSVTLPLRSRWELGNGTCPI